MSKKFSEFTNNNLNNFSKSNENIVNDFKRQNPQDYNNLQNLLSKYNNMNQEQLFNEFLKTAQQKKMDGTLSLEYINNIRNTIFPMLTFEQQQVFEELVRYLR